MIVFALIYFISGTGDLRLISHHPTKEACQAAADGVIGAVPNVWAAPTVERRLRCVKMEVSPIRTTQ